MSHHIIDINYLKIHFKYYKIILNNKSKTQCNNQQANIYKIIRSNNKNNNLQ